MNLKENTSNLTDELFPWRYHCLSRLLRHYYPNRLFVSRTVNKKKDSSNYFFASNSLPWYLVGSSVIAANISAEQFIGMSGSGFAMGMAIATYEWLAAIMLIMVALWFLPVFVHMKIHTMPQFLEVRYNKLIKTVLAIFWLFLFIFVNLTSILYLGALSLKTIFGINIEYAIAGLAFSPSSLLWGEV